MKKHIKIVLLLTIAFGSYHIAAAQNKSGFVKLFDGKTLNGWKKAIGYNTYEIKVVQGAIEGTVKGIAGGGVLVSDGNYHDFVLEMDIRADEKLLNDGLFLHAKVDYGYMTWINGLFCEVSPDSLKWTGGLKYDNSPYQWVYPMDLNATAKTAYKAGVYNHIKIECIGNETKTWVNGIAAAYFVDTVSHSGKIGLEFQGKPTKESIGKKVYFKNIRIKTTNLHPIPFPPGVYVVNYASNTLTAYEKNNGWQLLFDGKTPAGWHSAGKTTFPQKGWIIGNGLLTVDPQVKDQPSGGDILTDGQYSAFDLSFEFLTTPVANSGVKYFVTVDDKNGPLGLEYQVLDDALHPDAKLGRNGDRTESSLYDLIARNIPNGMSSIVKPVGEWNTGRIVVYPNNHVEHYLNGVKVLEYDRLSPEFKALIAISKYQHYNGFGIGPKGYILLQDHGCIVSFRSIKIKTL